MVSPNIFNYTDYRKFLKDYYEENKKKCTYFSYRYWSQKAGINASAFYKYIIDGKRGLTKASILKTARAIGFAEDEVNYFENLVYFNQSDSLKDKDMFFNLLMEKRSKINIHIVQKDSYEFYTEWYHTIIREIATMTDFSDDYPGLARLLLPAITPRQAKESIELLLRLQMLVKEKDGTYKHSNPLISTGPEVKNFAVMRFQMEMLKLALDSFEKFKGEQRLMAATTFSISEQTFEHFKAKIRQLRQELMEMARNDSSPEKVYHLNINLFPVSKKIPRKVEI